METDDIGNVKFQSYDDLLKFVKDFETKNYVQLNRVYAKKLSAPCVLKKYPVKIKTANSALTYYNLTYMCVNGGNYKYSGSNKRKTSTSKLECPMFMRFRLSADGQTLEMADYNTSHNHVVNKDVFDLLPKQRRLNEVEKQEAEKFIKLKCNKKMIKHYIKMNTGKTVTLKDLSNLKLKSNHFKDKNELLEAIEFLKMDQDADVEVFVNEGNELEGIYFQDEYMKKSFEYYPEVLLCDATYKLNNLRIPLYILLVINGNGNGEVAATFLLVNENESSLSNMIQHFKEKNCSWERTVSILTDKDLKERHVFEKEFPNSQLILCLFHTLKTFRTTITSQKMNITNEEREKCLKLMQKLAYSNDECEYQKNYDQFLNLKLGKVIHYYNTNWHGIREQWVEGLKRQNLTLNITTTNHLESLNQKIKQVVTKMSDLRSFYGDFLILLETIRDEYKSKAANMAAKKLVHSYDKNSVEAKYIDLLTPYAFTFVERNLKEYEVHGNSQNWNTTLQECNCNFRQNMKLPCTHIFYQRALCQSSLFDENLVNQRYKKVNYIAHNTNNNSSDVPSIPGPSTISVTKINNKMKTILTNNEKYRRTIDLCQNIASCSSECGNVRFEKIIHQLTKFLHLIKDGKDVSVLEDKAVVECGFEEIAKTADNGELSNVLFPENITIRNNITSDTSLYEEAIGAMVEIDNVTANASQSEEMNIILEAKTSNQREDIDNNITLEDMTNMENVPPAEINIISGIKTLKGSIPNLIDHTYCKETAESKIMKDLCQTVKKNIKINDLKDIQYKHLKMKRIGRPKGADHTVIGIKKAKQTYSRRKK